MADAMPRSTTASLRLTPSEAAAWRAAAASAGLSLSDWVRVQIGGSETRKRSPKREANAALLAQLAKIGNNLNQLARASNSGRAGERLQLLAQLSAIERELARVAQC